MSKTIEELAEQYVKDVYDGDTDLVYDTKNVLTWIFNKPLTQRLTDAEKDMIRKEYASTFPNDLDRDVTNISKECLLERIFGKDFFDKENNDEAVSVNTLYVGCHLNYNGKRVMLYDMEARVNAPGYMFIIYYDNCYTSVPMEEVKPIQLTPKILENCGFAYRDNLQSWILKGFTMEKRDNSSYWALSRNVCLNYLHELEYIYLLICGSELIKE